ncbi:MAG: hypothetical protein RLZZ301_1275 [Bacteroidota bacterium]|jgi:hypothetical protein
MGKIKKYELIIEEEAAFEIYGISCAFADYRLTWELNQLLDLNLIKSDACFEIQPPKTKQIHTFRYFFYHDEALLTRIYLIKNKQENVLFMPDRPMIDYFIVLKDNFTFEAANLMSDLRAINGVVAVFEFDYLDFEVIDYLTS